MPEPGSTGERSRAALVMGLGQFGGGLGVTRALLRDGYDVTVTDLRSADELADGLRELEGTPVRFVLGRHDEADFERAGVVVANPAVRPDHPLLERARAAGARVTSEIELFLEAVRARVVAVTGTQGKSSTCHMLATLLEATGLRVHLGGNIGGSLLARVDEIAPSDVVVLELSSYQLEALSNPTDLRRRGATVEAACLTNVLSDHLERHGTLAAYRAAKGRIFELLGESGTALVRPGEADLVEAPSVARGVRTVLLHTSRPGGQATTTAEAPSTTGLEIDGHLFRLDGVPLADVRDLTVPGTFQRENALAALGLARIVGAEPADLERAIGALKPLPHRLEPLGSVGGRRVHDNGVSTTPDSTVAALRSLPAGVHLILGGRAKDLSWTELLEVSREHVARAATFGEAGPELARALTGAGVRATAHRRLEDAVADAFLHAPPDADVLFSPACASFDAYPNFKARALAFRAAVAAQEEAPEAPGAPDPRRPGSVEL